MLVVVAVGFHSTAIIGIIPLLIYWIFVYQPEEVEYEEGRVRTHIGTVVSSSFNSFKTRYHALPYILLVSLEVFLVYNAASFITLVSSITGRYEGQVERIHSGFSVSLVSVMVLIFIFLTLYLMVKSENLNKDPINQFYLIIIASGIILFFLYGISSQMYRISLYLTCQFPVYISYLFGKKTKDRNYYAYLIIIFLLFIYFYNRTIVGGGWNEVIPYTSEFLGIN